MAGGIAEPSEQSGVEWQGAEYDPDWSSSSMGGGTGGPVYGRGGGGWGEDPVEAGTRAAVARLTRHGISVPTEQIKGTLEAAQVVLQGWPEPISFRGVEFWIETVVVAASARVLYDEEELRQDELVDFLRSWVRFENSWWHPPP